MIEPAFTLLLIINAPLSKPPEPIFFDAIEKVESGGFVFAVGDNGRSIGPLQIQYSYWLDSRVKGSYIWVLNRSYARQVAYRYMMRYERKLLEQHDYTGLARLHNGGPNWRKIKATIPYALKIKGAMRG